MARPCALPIAVAAVLSVAACGPSAAPNPWETGSGDVGGGSSGGTASGGGSGSSGSNGGGIGGSSGSSLPPSTDAGSDAGATLEGGAGPTGPGSPVFGGASGGQGGAAPVNGSTVTAGGITYHLIAPSSYAPGTPTPLLVVFSGTEGGAQMTSNLMNLGQTGISGFLCAVLDGVTYYGNGAAGATALDDVRAKYDVDDDRTYLLGESAGTTAALELGFHLRPLYFAAYWANDVNASDTPAQTAAQLGFAPWGQAGPGGDLPDAQAIVSAMQAAGYRLPTPAPYTGQGSGTHGDLNQLVSALSFFPGKSRK